MSCCPPDPEGTFISKVCGLSPFEFLLSLESSGRKIDGNMLRGFFRDVSTSEEEDFLESCFREIPPLDDLLLDKDTMTFLLKTEGNSIFRLDERGYPCVGNFHVEKILFPVLGRRPGILLAYYVGHFEEMFRFYHRKYPGFSRFEELVWSFVSRFGEEKSFPKKVLEKVKTVHHDIYNIICVLD